MRSRERVFTRPEDGTTMEVESCARCPLRVGCRERCLPRGKGRPALIHPACTLPVRPLHRRGMKPGTKLPRGLKRIRKPEVKPVVAAPLPRCRWCGERYRPEEEAQVVVDGRIIKRQGHVRCLKEDIRTEECR